MGHLHIIFASKGGGVEFEQTNLQQFKCLRGGGLPEEENVEALINGCINDLSYNNKKILVQ